MIAGLKRRQSYTLSHKDIGTSRYGYDLAIDNIACIEFDGGGGIFLLATTLLNI
jgi:hypothetical protein